MAQSDQKISRRIICVSHLTGAEGEAIARSVSERLGFRYLDEEIIEKAAEWVDLHPSVIGDVERRKSLMARIGETMTGQSSPRLPQGGGHPVRQMPSAEDLRALIRDVIRETAQEGGIVIASHAASMVLADRPDVFRVLVTASPETRADRIASSRELDRRRAEKVVEQEDSARADYMKRFHGVELELPTHYDLVVNTDKLAAERGADVIVLAAE
jgi:Cytidylate kinase-like family